MFICAVGTLPLGTGCAKDGGTQEEPVRTDEADKANTGVTDEGEAGVPSDMSSEERLAAAGERMQVAVQSGRVDQSGADLRMLGRKIREQGSEEIKAELDGIIKPFTAEKLTIRAGIQDGSIDEADGQAQLDALHEQLRMDFEALADKI